MTGTYDLGEKVHFDVCRSYRVFAPAGQVDHPWSHSGWEILVGREVRESQAQIRVRGKFYSMNQGQALFINSREEHTEIFPHDRPSQFDCLVFTKELLNATFEETSLNPAEILVHRVDHCLQSDLIDSVRSLLELRDAYSPGRLAFECLSMELLMLLLERCPTTASVKLKALQNRGFYPSNIARAKKVLALNLANADFDLDDLAESAGISKFHLVRSFKARVGLSPIQYLNEVRIEYAKSLLERHVPVSEVALRSGFQTFSAFNKAFKKKSGLPPAKYRGLF